MNRKLKHNDHPVNFLKLMDKLPKSKNFFSFVEKFALLNVLSNYKMWPSFIFAPSSVWLRALIETRVFSDDEIETKTIPFAEDMQAMGGFVYTKDIYTFDQTLLDNLIKTPIYEINPIALTRLPEQTIFIELDGKLSINGKKVAGLYAYYNDDLAAERFLKFETISPELRQSFENYPCKLAIRILWDDEERDNVFCCSIPLKDGKIKDNLNEVCEIRKKAIEHEKKYYEAPNIDEWVQVISTITPLLLYLCSEEPDIKDKKHPKLKHVAYYDKDKPKRIFSPPIIRTWEVGKEIGKTIRNAKNKYHGRSTITPHLRRAHWHGFYKGKRNSEERELIYKWIPPIFVTPQEHKETTCAQ